MSEPRDPAISTAIKRLVRPLPSPAEILRRGPRDGEWLVPVELVLACSRSAFVQMVYARAARGDWYKPTAAVFARGKRFFAVIEFHETKYHGVFLPLDVWPLENRTEVEAVVQARADRGDAGWAR